MRQIPDDPIIRFMERTGYAPRHDSDDSIEVCCATCFWFVNGLCTVDKPKPILVEDIESCENWEDADG